MASWLSSIAAVCFPLKGYAFAAADVRGGRAVFPVDCDERVYPVRAVFT
jgi:hypothetical protein